MKAKLMVAASEHCADMLYASGFMAPDPFIWFEEAGGRRGLVLSQLEYSRGVKECRSGLEVWCAEDLRAEGGAGSSAELLPRLAERLGVSCFVVPAEFPFGLAEELRRSGLSVECGPKPFFPERQVKTAAEVEQVTRGLRAAEAAMVRALTLLHEADIGRSRELFLNGKALTSEIVRAEIGIELLRQGAVATSTIVACGRQAADPHCNGGGVLLADAPIVIDIFPRLTSTGYWGDLTRTVVKGPAPAIVKRAFEAVRAAREAGKKEIRAGVPGKVAHEAAARVLIEHGFENRRDEHGPSGFIHGLGHGVGLDIHEAPRLNAGADRPLQAGEVVTVEPGLYYPSWGGIRLEDMVVVESDGCRDLNSLDTFLEIL